MCCNYFYVNVKWPLTCILICIKAHLLKDKQIPSVGKFDEAKSVTLLRGHLSFNSWFISQILPQIISFVNLGTWEANSGKGRILHHFGRFLAQEWRNRESPWKCQVCTWRRHSLFGDGVRLWRSVDQLTCDDLEGSDNFTHDGVPY